MKTTHEAAVVFRWLYRYLVNSSKCSRSKAREQVLRVMLSLFWGKHGIERIKGRQS